MLNLSFLQYVQTTIGGIITLGTSIAYTILLGAVVYGLLDQWSHSFITLDELKKEAIVMNLVGGGFAALIVVELLLFYFRAELIRVYLS